MPLVAATPTQPRELKLARKKPKFDFCHCQNLTVLKRPRLKLVHPSRQIQRKSLVSWRKVELCTQSRRKQITASNSRKQVFHIILCTLIETQTQKTINFRHHPNSDKTTCKTIISKSQNSPTAIEQELVKTIQTVIKQHSNSQYFEKSSHFYRQ